MKNKITFLILSFYLISISFIRAQTKDVFEYEVSLTSKYFNNYKVIRFFKPSFSYTNLDTAKVHYLTQKYIDDLFSKKENEILSSYVLNYPKDRSIPEILKPEIISHSEPATFFIEGDTLFYKNFYDTYDKPIFSKNGNYILGFDTVQIEDLDGAITQEIYINEQNFKDLFGGFVFFETWDYNSRKGAFNKNIDNIITFIEYKDNDFIEESLKRKLVDCYFDLQNSESTKLLAKNIIYDVKVIPDYDDDYDIYYDNRFLETNKRNEIILDLFESLKNKKIQAYTLSRKELSVIDTVNTNMYFNEKIRIVKSKLKKYLKEDAKETDDLFSSLKPEYTYTKVIYDTIRIQNIREEYKDERDPDEIDYLIEEGEYYEYDEDGNEVYSKIKVEIIDKIFGIKSKVEQDIYETYYETVCELPNLNKELSYNEAKENFSYSEERERIRKEKFKKYLKDDVVIKANVYSCITKPERTDTIIIADTIKTRLINPEYRNLTDKYEIEELIDYDEYYLYDEDGEYVYSIVEVIIYDTIYKKIPSVETQFELSNLSGKLNNQYLYSADEELNLIKPEFLTQSFLTDTIRVQKVRAEYINLTDEYEIDELIEYGEYYEYDEDGNEVYSKKQVEILDTIYELKPEVKEDIFETYTQKINFKLSDISHFRFYEDWYFDEKTYTIQKKVKGIALIAKTDKLDKNGNRFSFKPVVYFKLN